MIHLLNNSVENFIHWEKAGIIMALTRKSWLLAYYPLPMTEILDTGYRVKLLVTWLVGETFLPWSKVAPGLYIRLLL